MEIIVFAAPTLSTCLRTIDGVGVGGESARARGSDGARRAPAQRRLEDRHLKDATRERGRDRVATPGEDGETRRLAGGVTHRERWGFASRCVDARPRVDEFAERGRDPSRY